MGSYHHWVEQRSDPSLGPNQECQRRGSWMVLCRPTRPSRTNTQKTCPFHLKRLECKSRKSRNTWSNRQIWPWNPEWSGAKASRVLPREGTVIANILFHKRRLYKWTSPDGQYQNQIDYIFCSQWWKSSIQSAKTTPGADCGSHCELLIVKFRLKLKKVGKTTRPFGYALNQIPYNYTVEVTSRFKGLDLIDRLPEELWMEVHDIVHEAGIKTIPKKKKCKRQNAFWGSLTNSCEEKQQAKERRRDIPISMQSSKE